MRLRPWSCSERVSFSNKPGTHKTLSVDFKLRFTCFVKDDESKIYALTLVSRSLRQIVQSTDFGVQGFYRNFSSFLFAPFLIPCIEEGENLRRFFLRSHFTPFLSSRIKKLIRNGPISFVSISLEKC